MTGLKTCRKGLLKVPCDCFYESTALFLQLVSCDFSLSANQILDYFSSMGENQLLYLASIWLQYSFTIYIHIGSEMNFHFISDSFYHMLNSQKREKNRVFLPILLRKTRQRRDVTYDVIGELRRLGLSKCCLALCHKLIYEIAIFHSINGETCDKSIYYNTCVKCERYINSYALDLT